MHCWKSWILGGGLLLGVAANPVQAQETLVDPALKPSSLTDSLAPSLEPQHQSQQPIALPVEPTPPQPTPSLCQLAQPQDCVIPDLPVLDSDRLSYQALDLAPIAPASIASAPPIAPIAPAPLDLAPLDLAQAEPAAPDAKPSEAKSPYPRWSVSVYGGVLNSVNLQESLLLTSDLENSYMAGIGATQALIKRRAFNFELDAQLLKHFGDQRHFEATAAVSFRWKDFFWDRFIDTSFAFGEGLSLATEAPPIEKERNGKANGLLNYLMFEWTFALPNKPDWELVMRMNHRSGGYGTFNGVSAGSNLYGVGLRHHF